MPTKMGPIEIILNGKNCERIAFEEFQALLRIAVAIDDIMDRGNQELPGIDPSHSFSARYIQAIGMVHAIGLYLNERGESAEAKSFTHAALTALGIRFDRKFEEGEH